MIYRQIDPDIRSEIRFFAFWLGNITLCPNDTDIELDYSDCLNQNNEALGYVFSVYLNHLRVKYRRTTVVDPSHRAAQWLFDYCCSGYVLDNTFEDWEIDAGDLQADFFDSIKTFAFLLGKGMDEYSANVKNYTSYLFDGGSFIEGVISVFTNVIQIDDTEKVLNFEKACARSIQFINKYIDSEYEVYPPFEDWETELI